jgi:hypothetical protein
MRGEKAWHVVRGRLPATTVRRLSVAAIVATCLLCLRSNLAAPQSISAPAITVDSTVRAQPGTRVHFPIRIAPNAPRNSFVRVRGLPPTAVLSGGHAIGPGTWAISVAVASDLDLLMAVTPQGSFEVLITLLTIDGSVLNEAKCTLQISNAAPSPEPEARPLASPTILRSGVSPEVQPSPATKPDDRALALHLLQRGDELVAEGNIAPARLLYERAISLGLAQAAMALAATFDPNEFKKLNVQGIEPSTREARRWYERARELGADEADLRLRRLGPE